MLILTRRRLITGAAATSAYAALGTREAKAAIALVAHAATSLSSSGGTSSPVDTTGATLLIACVLYNTTNTPTLSDNLGNTWTLVIAHSSLVSVTEAIYYVANPTVGAGHTITVAGASTNSCAFLLAFSGTLTVSPYDSQESGAGSGSNVTTLQASAAKTPSVDNAVIASVVGWNGGGPYSINGGFTITDQHNFSASGFGGGAAYLIQGAKASANPTWTNGGTAQKCATGFAIFKPSVVTGHSRIIQ